MSNTGTYLETILSLRAETRLLRKECFGGCEYTFSHLLPSREGGELLLTFTACSKISDSPCQAQTVLSPASIKVPKQGYLQKNHSNGFIKAWKHKRALVHKEKTND